MSIKEEVEKQLKTAMVDKNELVLSVLRMVKSAVINTEIEKGQELDDEEMLLVLEKQAKQRKDSIAQFEAGERKDLAEREKNELQIINTFLPDKMADDDIRKIVKEVIVGNKEADFGKIMGLAMSELKGKADGSTVQRIVKEEMGA
jgi:uncharacterized protein YqeY